MVASARQELNRKRFCLFSGFPRQGLITILVALAVLPFVSMGDAKFRNRTLIAPAPKKRPITVDDVIGMTRLPPQHYGGASTEHFAVFSPDGGQFLVLLRKGNLEHSTNDFSLILFRTAEVLDSPKPDVLVQMASSSNRDAIRQVRWLPDNNTVVFLGETPDEPSQVYRFNVATRVLSKLTEYSRAVTDFDLAPDGRSMVFEADSQPETAARTTKVTHDAIVLNGQGVDDILAGRYHLDRGPDVFLQKLGQSPVALPPVGENYQAKSARISPDGNYVLVDAVVRNVPPEWKRYQDAGLERYFAFFAKLSWPGRINFSNPHVYFLFDARTGAFSPVVNAPCDRRETKAVWKADGSALYLKTHLPLDLQDPVERAAREKQTFEIEVKLPGLAKRKITDKEWPGETKAPEKTPSLDVKLEQDINTPPTVFAFDHATGRKRLLLDLNPQFQELDFGRVEVVEWKAAGIPVMGGLYLPPDYTPGKKYPLVIQTHGFERNKFSMDGLPEWGSAFAARPLAARGVVVLQVSEFLEAGGDDRVESNRTLGATIEESYKNFYALTYETAIDLLDGRGIIDRDRVGIVGFSRTVCFVGYTLTHSEYHFAAASLVDGIDCGYLQYLVYPYNHWDSDQLNGGKKPFGDGLKDWLKKSPNFSLDRVNTPVRLLELQPRWVLQQWEWYAALTLQKKPVDYVLIPDQDYKGENHLLVQPWERKIAQEGLVDWFCFWLKGEQDPDPRKSDQYSRWRRLQNMQAGGG